jgi:hypothetical protein
VYGQNRWGTGRNFVEGLGVCSASHFQARIVLTVLYVVVLGPFGICVHLFADTLRTKERPSQWLNRPPEIIDMPWAHRQ